MKKIHIIGTYDDLRDERDSLNETVLAPIAIKASALMDEGFAIIDTAKDYFKPREGIDASLDLRLALADEEIDRNSYVVVILGDRYGKEPNELKLKAFAQSGKNLGLGFSDLKDRSISEIETLLALKKLEILYGDKSELPLTVLVKERDRHPTKREAINVKSLADRLQQRYPDSIVPYELIENKNNGKRSLDPETVKVVRAKITDHIGLDEADSARDKFRLNSLYHEDIKAHNQNGYFPRQYYEDRVELFLDDPGASTLLICGRDRVGKTRLLSNIDKIGENQNRIVINLYCRNKSKESILDALLYSLGQTLKIEDRKVYALDLNFKKQEAIKRLKKLAKDHQVVLVLDDLDQTDAFEPESAFDFTPTPTEVGEGFKLIVSTTDTTLDINAPVERLTMREPVVTELDALISKFFRPLDAQARTELLAKMRPLSIASAFTLTEHRRLWERLIREAIYTGKTTKKEADKEYLDFIRKIPGTESSCNKYLLDKVCELLDIREPEKRFLCHTILTHPEGTITVRDLAESYGSPIVEPRHFDYCKISALTNTLKSFFRTDGKGAIVFDPTLARLLYTPEDIERDGPFSIHFKRYAMQLPVYDPVAVNEGLLYEISLLKADRRFLSVNESIAKRIIQLAFVDELLMDEADLLSYEDKGIKPKSLLIKAATKLLGSDGGDSRLSQAFITAFTRLKNTNKYSQEEVLNVSKVFCAYGEYLLSLMSNIYETRKLFDEYYELVTKRLNGQFLKNNPQATFVAYKNELFQYWVHADYNFGLNWDRENFFNSAYDTLVDLTSKLKSHPIYGPLLHYEYGKLMFFRAFNHTEKSDTGPLPLSLLSEAMKAFRSVMGYSYHEAIVSSEELKEKIRECQVAKAFVYKIDYEDEDAEICEKGITIGEPLKKRFGRQLNAQTVGEEFYTLSRALIRLCEKTDDLGTKRSYLESSLARARRQFREDGDLASLKYWHECAAQLATNMNLPLSSAKRIQYLNDFLTSLSELRQVEKQDALEVLKDFLKILKTSEQMQDEHGKDLCEIANIRSACRFYASVLKGYTSLEPSLMETDETEYQKALPLLVEFSITAEDYAVNLQDRLNEAFDSLEDIEDLEERVRKSEGLAKTLDLALELFESLEPFSNGAVWTSLAKDADQKSVSLLETLTSLKPQDKSISNELERKSLKLRRLTFLESILGERPCPDVTESQASVNSVDSEKTEVLLELLTDYLGQSSQEADTVLNWIIENGGDALDVDFFTYRQNHFGVSEAVRLDRLGTLLLQESFPELDDFITKTQLLQATALLARYTHPRLGNPYDLTLKVDLNLSNLYILYRFDTVRFTLEMVNMDRESLEKLVKEREPYRMSQPEEPFWEAVVELASDKLEYDS